MDRPGALRVVAPVREPAMTGPVQGPAVGLMVSAVIMSRVATQSGSSCGFGPVGCDSS